MNNNYGGGFSRAQNAILARSILLGGRLVVDHPEIGDWYRIIDPDRMLSQKDIALRIGVPSQYQVGVRLAVMGVSRAIRGYHGDDYVAGYPGLITDPRELESLMTAHLAHGGLLSSAAHKRNSTGLQGLSFEEHQRAGHLGGTRSVSLGIGVAGRSPDQMRSDSLSGVLARGRVPYSSSELELIHALLSDPRFYSSSGISSGRPKMGLIADEVNRVCHDSKPVRSSIAIADRVRYDKYHAKKKTRSSSSDASSQNL